FEKQLAEYKSRREGPIIKFSEEGVWNARKRSLDYRETGLSTEERLGAFEAAQVEPFKESKILNSPTLAAQFDQAQTLLNQFRFDLEPVSKIFDVEKLAKYYAVIDLTQAYHSLVWHNQRFYFNPVINQLEPIGFDGFTEKGKYRFSTMPFLGANPQHSSPFSSHNLVFRPFKDSVFVSAYIKELERMTSKDYLDQLSLDLAPGLTAREKVIQEEVPNYQYENPLYENAGEIRRILFPLNNGSLRAHRIKGKDLVRVANTHVLPLEIIGYGNNNQSRKDLKQPIWLNSQVKNAPPEFQEISIPASAKVIFFRLPGLSRVYSSNLAMWSGENVVVPAQNLLENVDIQNNPHFQLVGKEIQFRIGKYKVNQDIIIPPGYQVRMVEGTEIDFVQGAKFLSYSPVFLEGGPETPIRITSSDHSANGFTILNTTEESRLNYATFEDFNTLNDRGWS
ncbi:MAG: hypothetical protein KDD63_16205, partial [Bacteroidetes bacterium]|nr:hypothetical protein [Bacteroidota bacterium]